MNEIRLIHCRPARPRAQVRARRGRPRAEAGIGGPGGALRTGEGSVGGRPGLGERAGPGGGRGAVARPSRASGLTAARRRLGRGWTGWGAGGGEKGKGAAGGKGPRAAGPAQREPSWAAEPGCKQLAAPAVRRCRHPGGCLLPARPGRPREQQRPAETSVSFSYFFT